MSTFYPQQIPEQKLATVWVVMLAAVGVIWLGSCGKEESEQHGSGEVEQSLVPNCLRSPLNIACWVFLKNG